MPAAFTLVELLMVITILSVLLGIGFGIITRIQPGEQGVPGVIRARLSYARNTARAGGAPTWVRFYSDKRGEDEFLFLEVSVLSPLVSLSFEEGGKGGYGLDGTLVGGKLCPDGRFGNGMTQPGPGAPGLIIETEGRDYLRLDYGFIARIDLKPTERCSMTLFKWGTIFSLGLDANGVIQGGVTLKGEGNFPGKRINLTGTNPLPLGIWASLELSYNGEKVVLRVDSREVAVEKVPGKPYYKAGEPLVVSDPQAPVAGVLDGVQLMAIDVEQPEILPAGVEILSGPKLIRFAPGGALDPELHPGPARLTLGLPGGVKRSFEVSRLGVVQ